MCPSASSLITSDAFYPDGSYGTSYELPLTGFKDGEDTNKLTDGYAAYTVLLEPFKCSDDSYEGVAVSFEAGDSTPQMVLSIGQLYKYDQNIMFPLW